MLDVGMRIDFRYRVTEVYEKWVGDGQRRRQTFYVLYDEWKDRQQIFAYPDLCRHFAGRYDE